MRAMALYTVRILCPEPLAGSHGAIPPRDRRGGRDLPEAIPIPMLLLDFWVSRQDSPIEQSQGHGACGDSTASSQQPLSGSMRLNRRNWRIPSFAGRGFHFPGPRPENGNRTLQIHWSTETPPILNPRPARQPGTRPRPPPQSAGIPRRATEPRLVCSSSHWRFEV